MVGFSVPDTNGKAAKVSAAKLRSQQWAQRRAQQMPGEAQAKYNIATQTRYRKALTGTASMGSGHDYHTRDEVSFLRSIELARKFDRDDIVVGQGVDRVVDNVLQGGVRLDAETGDDGIDRELMQRWLQWCADPDRCHAAGELTFHDLSKLALRHVIVDGDIVVLLLKDGSLEPVEAHRIRNPDGQEGKGIVNGIRLDHSRRRLEYFILTDDINPNGRVKRDGIVARKVRDTLGHRQLLHIYDPKRVSQTRGISAFARMVDAIGMHDDIQFAKLLQQQIVSCYAVIHNVDPDYEVPSGDVQTGKQVTDASANGFARTTEAIAPGMDWFSRPGETLSGFSPNIPNQEWFDQTKLILTFIAVNLKIPLPVLLLDPSQTNFSGWRGAMDQARIGFRGVQAWMIDRHYRPVYEWKVRQWLTADKLLMRKAGYAMDGGQLIKVGRFKVDAFAHRWSPPTWNYIEPAKDSKSDKTIIDNLLNSRRSVLARRGLDLDEVDNHAVADRAALLSRAINAAAVINKKYPDAKVGWRELVGPLAMPSVEPVEVEGTVEVEAP